jgi:membrane associated rhomboid family serine protease
VAIIAVNGLAWVFLQGLGATVPLARSVCELGLIPGDLLGNAPSGASTPLAPGMACVLDGAPDYHTLITSMFMHGGWLHLLGNMWFLWIFGNNIEDSMGHARFAVFYILAGVAAAVAQIVVDPSSTIPMVGASGAISGVLGAYIVLYPHARVHTLVPLGFFITTIDLPAYVMLGYWVLLQILGGLPSLAGVQQGGGVAFMAHLGGFVAGMALVKLFETSEHRARRRAWVRPQRVAHRRFP